MQLKALARTGQVNLTTFIQILAKPRGVTRGTTIKAGNSAGQS